MLLFTINFKNQYCSQLSVYHFTLPTNLTSLSECRIGSGFMFVFCLLLFIEVKLNNCTLRKIEAVLISVFTNV